MKKILFILLFPFMAEFLVACCPCDEPVVYKAYSLAALRVSHLDNHGETPVMATDSVIKTAYGIRLDLTVEKTAALFDRSSLFFNTANAFSCGCREEPLQYLPTDSIVSIQIITDQPFDAAHPAGSDISGYFLLLEGETFSSLTEYLAKAPPRFFIAGDETISLNLMLMTAPTLHQNHQFQVRISLSGNSVLEQQTTTIKLY